MAVLTSPVVLISSIPPVTRYFSAATLVFSLLHAWVRWTTDINATPYLTLVPGSSLFYPWTFLTSASVETSFLELLATLIFVPASLKYLERLWGSIETIKFIAVTVGFSNIIAFGFNWLEFIATRNAEMFLYGMEYHGQMSLQIGLMVAFTQLMPEHQVQVMGVLKTRVRNLPMAYLTLSTVFTILGFQCPWIIIQFGWFVSWVYLRFYKKNTGDAVGGVDIYGDRSETFSLVSWFPPLVHYPIGMLGNTVFTVANRLHLIPAGHDLESGGYSQVPGSARAEAERRRAMALKALDQRLASTSGPSGSQNASPSIPRPPPTAAAPPRPDTSSQSVQAKAAGENGAAEGSGSSQGEKP